MEVSPQESLPDPVFVCCGRHVMKELLVELLISSVLVSTLLPFMKASVSISHLVRRCDSQDQTSASAKQGLGTDARNFL